MIKIIEICFCDKIRTFNKHSNDENLELQYVVIELFFYIQDLDFSTSEQQTSVTMHEQQPIDHTKPSSSVTTSSSGTVGLFDDLLLTSEHNSLPYDDKDTVSPQPTGGTR